MDRKDPPRSLLIPRESLSSEGETTIPSQPPPLAMVKQQRSPRADVKHSLKRISTSPPPLAPITKVAPSAQDMEVVAQSRMNLRQALRRARKTKQQPRNVDMEDALELPSDKATEQTTQLSSVASKSKPPAGKLMESTSSVAVAVPNPAKKPAQQGATSKQYKTRNAYGAGRKPAIPPQPSAATVASASGSSGSSDDLHQELAAPWPDEPRESRVLPSEYGQDQFLDLFGLYTHDMMKKFCQLVVCS